MKKRMIVSISLISLFVILLVLFFQWAPQLGAKANHAECGSFQKSKNFVEDRFVNPVPTSMNRPPNEAFRKMIQATGRRPQGMLKTYPIDRESYAVPSDSTIRLTWLGHSTLLIKIDQIVLLTDPVFSKRASVVSFMGPRQFDYTHDYSIDDLPPVDLVLITHDHYDHLDYRSIKKLSERVNHFLVPLGVGAHLKKWGVPPEKIYELDWWNEITINGLTLVSTPARHFTGRRISQRFTTLWCGWAILGSSGRLYLTGDSGYFPGFREIGEKLGPFDLSFMECGQYSPYWPSIHMQPEESVQAAIDSKSVRAMPIHWGKFSLSMHPWNEPPNRFRIKAQESGLSTFIPEIGKTISVRSFTEEEWWN